jgi:hypothetical protein
LKLTEALGSPVKFCRQSFKDKYNFVRILKQLHPSILTISLQTFITLQVLQRKSPATQLAFHQQHSSKYHQGTDTDYRNWVVPWFRRLRADLVPFQARPSEICDRHSGIRAGFPANTLGFPCQHHSTKAPYLVTHLQTTLHKLSS